MEMGNGSRVSSVVLWRKHVTLKLGRTKRIIAGTKITQLTSASKIQILLMLINVDELRK